MNKTLRGVDSYNFSVKAKINHRNTYPAFLPENLHRGRDPFFKVSDTALNLVNTFCEPHGAEKKHLGSGVT